VFASFQKNKIYCSSFYNVKRDFPGNTHILPLASDTAFGTWFCWESQAFWTEMISALFPHSEYAFRSSLHQEVETMWSTNISKDYDQLKRQFKHFTVTASFVCFIKRKCVHATPFVGLSSLSSSMKWLHSKRKSSCLRSSLQQQLYYLIGHPEKILSLSKTNWLQNQQVFLAGIWDSTEGYSNFSPEVNLRAITRSKFKSHYKNSTYVFHVL